MASYDSRSPSPSPASSPSSRRMRSCAKRFEHACCTLATYFPLGFIYSLTTWAVWVDARVGFHKENPDDKRLYSKTIPSAIGVVLYLLLNASYTIAVFTHPGSPTNSTSLQRRGKYSVLPTSEPTRDFSDVQTITVSSSGGTRYCKKCHVPKPDRAHHCSTCKRCVLKMDHHCPWLATCLGLHNYKAFLLFLIYVSLFCWACFLNTVFWVYKEVFESNRYVDGFGPVNVIILAILSGLIGLVLTGFTAWHIYLSVRGQTTIECLEQTRYLCGVRKQVEANRQEHLSHNRQDSEGLANNLKRIGDQVLEFHANAVPGASRYEEGEEHVSPSPSIHLVDNNSSQSVPQHQWPQSRPLDSPAQRALRTAAASNKHPTYRDLETQRESDRYEEYVSDQEASKLPNAFDLGWRKNLLHVFGPNPLLWWLPICNTTGDGWRWEVSEMWFKANEEVSRRRDERLRHAQSQNPASNQRQGWDRRNPHRDGYGYGYGRSSSPQTATRYYDDNHNNTVGYDGSTIVGSGDYGTDGSQGSAVSMHTLQLDRPRSHNGKGTMKREFDRGGADGEIDSFQVSGSEDESSESENEREDGDNTWVAESQPKSRRDNRNGTKDRDEWERQW